MNSKDAIKQLEAAGWVKVRQEGSHVTLKKEGEPLLITIPHPRKDLKPGLIRRLERDSKVRLR